MPSQSSTDQRLPAMQTATHELLIGLRALELALRDHAGDAYLHGRARELVWQRYWRLTEEAGDGLLRRPTTIECDRLREAVRAVAAAWLGGEDAEIGTAIGAASDLVGFDAPGDGDGKFTAPSVLYVAHCSRCKATTGDDGGEYQPTPEKAVAVALSEYGEFERRGDELVCPACCVAEDEPDA